uniref:Uncharacterized protein n=1 Tax=Octopus bimaculoides TaxID=37653 RepID=A0A0L8FK91_OCTBM
MKVKEKLKSQPNFTFKLKCIKKINFKLCQAHIRFLTLALETTPRHASSSSRITQYQLSWGLRSQLCRKPLFTTFCFHLSHNYPIQNRRKRIEQH